MKTKTMRWMKALPLAGLLGCGLTAPTEPQGPSPQQLEQVRQALTGYTFDSTAIAQAPSGGLPATLLTTRAFETDLLARGLIQTSEPFTSTGQTDTRGELESRTWLLEKDSSTGRVLVLRKTEDGPAAPQDEALLERSALERLGQWGIPAEEMGPVRQVQSLLQDQDGSQLGLPVTHSHKTFVMRAINGIRVEGHRAVVTHGVDGGFARALVKWPALSREGNKLYTRLTVAEIEQRAAEALRLEGELGGPVRLSWKYVPTPLSTGEVVLTLMVSAAMPSLMEADGTTEEPRVVDVDVSAL